MTKLWGGRFTKKINPLVEKFTQSIHFDQKLAFCDCWGSLFHIDVLKEAGLLTAAEHKKLHDGLHDILDTILKGTFKADTTQEDIHSQIQGLLEKKTGDVALKLHTCRSRNDQIVFDTKLFCQLQIAETVKALAELDAGLKNLIEKNAGICIPGYTHLQHAIPIHLSDHLCAYAEMFKQDVGRLTNIKKSIVLTMGAGALAGTFIEARHYNQAMAALSPELGEIKPSTNSIYTISDRDFVLETLTALSMVGMHLSRLAEDFILWATKEFDFIDIDESFCTGSSLMPQKKNPDVLELIRGYTGRLYGNLLNVLVMMKGLPLSYNRDMQNDKEPLFDSLELVQSELIVLAALLKNVSFKKENIDKQLDDEGLYATDLADYLVQNGVPFKEAHTIIGRLVHHKFKGGQDIEKMPAQELKEFHPALTPAVVKSIINPHASVAAKKSIHRPAKKK